MKNIKKIENFTLTIDECDYVYKVKDNSLEAYWCDCPIEFDIRLATQMITFINFVNQMLEDEYFSIERKEKNERKQNKK